jgi:competence protein ComEC
LVAVAFFGDGTGQGTMPQEGVVLKQLQPDEEDSVRTVQHALIPSGKASGGRRVLPVQWGLRRLSGSLHRGSWNIGSFSQRISKMVDEEAAYGHGFLFVPVLLGLGAATWFAFPNDPPVVGICVLLLLWAVAAIVVRYRTGRTPVLIFSICLVLAGCLVAHLETKRSSTVILDSPVTTTVTGEVHRREPAGAGRWRYFIRLSATSEPVIKRAPEHIVLLARSSHVPFKAGETISGRARLSPPSGPALPGLNDFAFRAYYDGVGAVGFFYGAPVRARLELTAPGDWALSLERRIFALRGVIADRIRETVPGDAGAFAAAIVTDERRAISEETTEALRVSGLAHIVAISGLNMALAAGIFFVGLRSCLGLFTGFAQAWPIKKIAAFGALLMATAYYLISGFAVSAERAYLMMAVMLIAVFFDRAAISLRNVAISALIIIAVSPSEIMGPSFQMSFSATAALVAGYAVWSSYAARRDAEPSIFAHGRLAPVIAGGHFMAGIFVTSLIGGLSTAIFSMEHFHRLSGYGLAANLAVMPLISFVVMPAGLVGMLLMPFGLDGPFIKLMGFGLDAVIVVAKEVASWGGNVDVGRQHPWFLAVASMGFVLLALLRTKLRLIGLPLIGLAFLLTWQEQREPVPDLLISEDGALVAHLGVSVWTNRSRPPDFIFDQWQRALLLQDHVGPILSPAGDSEAESLRDLPSGTLLDPQTLTMLRKEDDASKGDGAGRTGCKERDRTVSLPCESLVRGHDRGRRHGCGHRGWAHGRHRLRAGDNRHCTSRPVR